MGLVLPLPQVKPLSQRRNEFVSHATPRIVSIGCVDGNSASRLMQVVLALIWNWLYPHKNNESFQALTAQKD